MNLQQASEIPPHQIILLPLLDGPASTTWVILCLLHLYKYAAWRNDRGTVWWLCSRSRHGVRDFPECTALLLASWLFLEYKTEAHKLHRGIEWYFYATNRDLFAYTDKHCDFLYQDLWRSTFLRAVYTAARLAITVPANRVCFVHGHTYLGGEDNCAPKLLGTIQFPGLLYTSWVTV